MHATSTLERFEAKAIPEPNTGCWLWIGSATKDGYARISVCGKVMHAHRWAYLHFTGPIPAGFEVDHTCRQTICVNPAHLEAVTPQENTRRAIEARQRAQTVCSNGHEMNESTVYRSQNAGMRRKCRRCTADHQRAYQMRLREARRTP